MPMTAEYLKKLAETGLLGVLLVLSLIAIYFLYIELKKERDSRLQDLKDIFKGNLQWREEIKKSIENILDILRSKK